MIFILHNSIMFGSESLLFFRIGMSECRRTFKEQVGLVHVGVEKDVLDWCPIDFDEIQQVFNGEIPKPKEQVEQEQDVDRINE